MGQFSSIHPEVLIIGGGVIGLTIARELHRRGVGRIVLVEKGICGEESSWAAAGMLGPQAETDEPGNMLELCVESRIAYPDFASSLLEETGIDIELDRSGTMCLAFSDDDVARLERRVSWQTAAGLNAAMITGAEARRAEPFISPEVVGSALFSDDWQVENRKLCKALRRYADLNGISVFENAEVSELINENGKIVGAKIGIDEIESENTVLAAGAWTSLIKIGSFSAPVRMTPIRGQMIMYRTAKRLFEHVVYSPNGYLVPRNDGRILVGATSEDAGYVKENTDVAVRDLTRSAETIAPQLSGLKIADKWSGLRPRSADGLPVLGRLVGLGGLYFATGHYRNGILLAPRTGETIARAIVDGVDSSYFDVFGPDRFRAANANG